MYIYIKNIWEAMASVCLHQALPLSLIMHERLKFDFCLLVFLKRLIYIYIYKENDKRRKVKEW